MGEMSIVLVIASHRAARATSLAGHNGPGSAASGARRGRPVPPAAEPP